MSYWSNQDYFRHESGKSGQMEYTGQFIDGSSTSEVIQKLASTRKMLEKTLNKNHRLGVKVEQVKVPNNDLHHELCSPTFSYINQIYESYSKAPVNSKVLSNKSPVVKRTASAPMIYLKTKEKLIQENEELIKKECTFKPKINKSPAKQSYDSEELVSKQEWLLKMSKSKAEVLEQREKIKREQEDNLTKSSAFKSTTQSVSSNSAVDRLYTNERKGLKMEQMKRENEEKEASLYNFSPVISKSSIALMNNKQEAPLYTRIKEVQEEIKLKKNQLQTKTQNFCFKPKISEKSSRLAGYKCNESVIERLSKDSSKAKSISEQSSVPDKKESKSIDLKEFMNRQMEYLSKSQKEKQDLVSKSKQDLKFQPKINETSNFIANFKHNYSAESQKEKIERITKGALAKKAEIKAELEKVVFSDLKFEPKINPISQKLAKSSRFLNDNKELKLSKKLKAQASVAELDKVCSFSPLLKSPKKFEGLHSRYSQSTNIMQEIERERELKIKNKQELRNSLDAKDLNECTFRPWKFERIEHEGNVCVKGAERFFELKNLACRQKYEKEMREKKVLYKDQAR